MMYAGSDAVPPVQKKETIFKIPKYPPVYSVSVMGQKTMYPSISWSTISLKYCGKGRF